MCNGIDYKEMPSAIRVVGRSDRVERYVPVYDDIEKRMGLSFNSNYPWAIEGKHIVSRDAPSCNNFDGFDSESLITIDTAQLGPRTYGYDCDYLTFSGMSSDQMTPLIIRDLTFYKPFLLTLRRMYTVLDVSISSLGHQDDRVVGYISFSAPLNSYPESIDRVPDTELYRTIGPNGEPPLILMRHWVFPNTPEFADAVSAIGAKPAEEDEWVDCVDYYYGYFVK